MFLSGKKILVMGLLNQRSIAYGAATVLKQHGAHVAVSCQTETLRTRVLPLTDQLGADFCAVCDMTDPAAIGRLMTLVSERWGGLDGLVHCAAFADPVALAGEFTEGLTRKVFLDALDVSVYTFIELVRQFRPLMRNRNASCTTLSYIGAERVVPHYNVMGVAKAALESTVRYLATDVGPIDQIRVNAVSAGALRTTSAAAVADFKVGVKLGSVYSPLRRAVTIEEVGGAIAFLCSDLASGVTAELIHVDCGLHAVVPGFQPVED